MVAARSTSRVWSRKRASSASARRRTPKGAAAASTSATAQSGMVGTPALLPRTAVRVHACYFLFLESGGTMKGTTCSLASKLARYTAAACCVAKGPTRTRNQVPRPTTFA